MRLVGRFADQEIVVLREPAVVELEAAAQVDAKALVGRFGDEAVVPAWRQRAVFAHFGPFGVRARRGVGRALGLLGLQLFADNLLNRLTIDVGLGRLLGVQERPPGGADRRRSRAARTVLRSKATCARMEVAAAAHVSAPNTMTQECNRIGRTEDMARFLRR